VFSHETFSVKVLRPIFTSSSYLSSIRNTTKVSEKFWNKIHQYVKQGRTVK
jgi:hypothetical protein